jgi:hypothetical protein
MYLVGKVLLEKVMRSLPSVKTIYVGISSKVSGTAGLRSDKNLNGFPRRMDG